MVTFSVISIFGRIHWQHFVIIKLYVFMTHDSLLDGGCFLETRQAVICLPHYFHEREKKRVGAEGATVYSCYSVSDNMN